MDASSGVMIPVSVVIPTLNRAAYLDGCLRALLALDYPPELYEVLVVDGGSTDETPHLVDAYAACFASCRFLIEPKAGSSAARNLGFRHAKYDYIALTDDDAEVAQDWLRTLVAEVGVHQMVVGKVMSYGEHRVQYGCRRSTFIGGSLPLPPLLTRYANCGCTCNMLVPKQIWHAVGGFDEELITAFDDSSFCLRALHLGYHVRYVDTAVVYHKHELKRPERFASHIMYRTYGMLKFYAGAPVTQTAFVVCNALYVMLQVFQFWMQYGSGFARAAAHAWLKGHRMYRQKAASSAVPLSADDERF